MKLKEILDDEIDWRIAELALLKTNHKTTNISINRRDIILKYSVVAVYALFEGFVVKAFKAYIHEINKLNLSKKDMHITILTEYMNQKYKLFFERNNLEKKCGLVLELEAFYDTSQINLECEIKTESNINLKVLNKLLNTYQIKEINDSSILDGLNKLLKFRNSIAHGETGIKMDDNLLKEHIDCVIRTMDQVRDNMITSFIHKSYLRTI